MKKKKMDEEKNVLKKRPYMASIIPPICIKRVFRFAPIKKVTKVIY